MPIDPSTLYIVPQDIREAVAPDGDYQGTCAAMSDEQLVRYIRQAQSRVDSVTGNAFSPTNVPELVLGLVLALATYYATLGYRKGKSLDAFHPVYLAYQDAIAVLDQIRADEIQVVPTADTDPVPVRQKPKVVNPVEARFFDLQQDLGLTITQGCSGPAIDVDPSLSGDDRW